MIQTNKETYYKHYNNCKKCGIRYGHDSKKDDGFCPLCIQTYHHYKSRWEKKLQNE